MSYTPLMTWVLLTPIRYERLKESLNHLCFSLLHCLLAVQVPDGL